MLNVKQVCPIPKGNQIIIMIDNRFPGIDLDLGIGWKRALRYGNSNDI